MKNKADKDKIVIPAQEVAVLIEGLRSDFRVFGDELKTINRKIEAVENTTARILEKVTQTDLRLVKIEKKLDSVDSRLTAVESPK